MTTMNMTIQAMIKPVTIIPHTHTIMNMPLTQPMQLLTRNVVRRTLRPRRCVSSVMLRCGKMVDCGAVNTRDTRTVAGSAIPS